MDNASLPSTDVQRPTQPLTEEELGQLPDGTPITAFGRHLYRCRHYGWLVGTPSLRDEYDTCPTCDCGLAEATVRIGRLIADLRASRARVKELEGKMELVWGNECGCVGSAFSHAGIPYE